MKIVAFVAVVAAAFPLAAAAQDALAATGAIWDDWGVICGSAGLSGLIAGLRSRRKGCGWPTAILDGALMGAVGFALACVGSVYIGGKPLVGLCGLTGLLGLGVVEAAAKGFFGSAVKRATLLIIGAGRHEQ